MLCGCSHVTVSADPVLLMLSRLCVSALLGTPVRVVRAKVGEAKERLYVYDGLYKVAEAKIQPSSDGPQVRCLADVGSCTHGLCPPRQPLHEPGIACGCASSCLFQSTPATALC